VTQVSARLHDGIRFLATVTCFSNVNSANPCLNAQIIAAVKNIDAPMLTRVWQELEYSIDVCRVTRGAHIEQL
jgi:hypothetical protein